MIELKVKPIDDDYADLCLTVPEKDADELADMLKKFLRLAKYEVREVEEFSTDA
ncbi:hypothetical protein [Maridesulfovibrio frigidus]|uniref:hypothetical protein n=1 Tax=Maridesulfovibrio frigidus TaxID=340956 RepID=UPI000B0E3B68|nr:hypothetical protein [Maridesulfovibrio frigidus]